MTDYSKSLAIYGGASGRICGCHIYLEKEKALDAELLHLAVATFSSYYLSLAPALDELTMVADDSQLRRQKVSFYTNDYAPALLCNRSSNDGARIQLDVRDGVLPAHLCGTVGAQDK